MTRIGSCVGTTSLLVGLLMGSQALGVTWEWPLNTYGYWTNASTWGQATPPTTSSTQVRVCKGGTCIVDAPAATGPLYVGINSGQPGATLQLVSGGSMFIGTSVAIGYNNYGAAIGTVVQTGGVWDNNNKTLSIGTTIGYGAYYMSGGTLTNVNRLTLGVTDYRDRGWMTISNSAPVKVAEGIFVGQNGTATLTIGAGGTLVGGTGYSSANYVAYGVSATGMVRQTGGTWDNNGKRLTIGNIGYGSYEMTGGVLTNLNSVYMSADYRARAEMTISNGAQVIMLGSGSTDQYGLFVGNAGQAALTIGDGGLLKLGGGHSGSTWIAYQGTASGRVDQVGGTWDNNDLNMTMGGNGGSRSLYRMSGGVFTNCAGFIVGNAATSTARVEVVGSAGRIYASTFTMGASASMLVAPDETGLTPIQVTGAVTLNGPLYVDFTNSTYHTELVLIDYALGGTGTRSGSFSGSPISLTEHWSADIEYDDANTLVKLVNIKGPPRGTVISVR